MRSDYFPIHAHSEFSALDGMGTVAEMVATVVGHGQPGLALTDHGTMAGVLQLYKHCMREGIAPFPGSELYVVTDATDDEAKQHRFHMGMVALSYRGYQTLVKLSSRSHTRERFHRKPLIDYADLSALHEAGLTSDLAITTGCYFGIIQQALVNDGYEKALRLTKMIAKWFPNTFVELQHHDIYADDHNDDDIVDALIDIADETGLPMVYGQDSHYCDREHQAAHDLMKDICYFGDNDDNRFPGGPYHLASTKELHEQWAGPVWDRIEEGHSLLLDMNNVTLPALDKYKFMVPAVAKTPDKKLRDMAVNAKRLRTAAKAGQEAEYVGQMNHELEVIKEMGFANYFLIVSDLCQWMRQEGIVFNIRGSANGSLVCYLVGITEVDPIQWGTSFKRFLSLARKKPPDIDIDIASGDRERVIARLRALFPTMVAIGTYGHMGLNIQYDEFGEEDLTGAVMVQYMAAMRKKLGDKFDGKVKPGHRKPLDELSNLAVRRSLGVHAGGYVLPTAEQPIDAYLPTALVPSSGTTVTQCVMEDVEDAGYVKLDLLGLRALETLSQAQRNLGNHPMDWDWMPWDDKKACNLLRSGWHTTGLFQFEGYSTAKGGKEMGVRNTMDAIICLALYRPALMAGGQKDMYLANRGKSYDERPFTLDPFFDDILNVTDGVAVFQEQVMDMCLAVGMAESDWNDLMKAVKASNDKIGEYAEGIMRRVGPIFIKCCMEKGIAPEEADMAWGDILGFTDYGFNRAHATSYGQMAYRSAYLKSHHPLEYMHGVLCSWAGTDKEKLYINEARKMKLSIGRPNINTSGVSWAIDPHKPNTLRKGFLTIKGIGDAAAEAIVANRPEGGYPDMETFCSLVPGKAVSGAIEYRKSGRPNGVMQKLQEAGALAPLGLQSTD